METIKRPHKKPPNMKFMGGGSGSSPPTLNHQRYEKARTSRWLKLERVHRSVRSHFQWSQNLCL